MFLCSNVIPKIRDTTAATANAPEITNSRLRLMDATGSPRWPPPPPHPQRPRGVSAGKAAAEPARFVRTTFAEFARETAEGRLVVRFDTGFEAVAGGVGT